MRLRWGFLLMALLAACDSQSHDQRLVGTWRSNQSESVAAALRGDPEWARVSPSALEQFTNNFGQLTLTYAQDTMTVRIRDTVKTFGYKVVEQGEEHVVIQTQGAIEDGRDIKIRFVEGGNGYWVDTGLGYSEKFERVR